jgi:lipopolysaccharide transport protein LptA
MKVFYSIILFLGCSILISTAQTNADTNAMTATNQPHGVEAILALVTTNHPPTPTNSPTQPRMQGPIKISSDGPADFDLNNHWVTYSDHVIVTNAEVRMTCEWLKANLPQTGDLTNIVAETNVVVDFTDEKGQKSRATGHKGVYFYHVENGVTNQTITLTGTPDKKPKLDQAQGTLTGDSIIWNLVTHHLTIEGSPEGIGFMDSKSPTGTNSPAAMTNVPTATNGTIKM